jgi:tetratricopeptide (TPR) repeat protein
MFLRRLGRKVLVLHSYRDGQGKVRQRRLADFQNSAELRAVVDGGWEEWRGRMQTTYPDCNGNWNELWRKARHLCDSAPEAGERGAANAPRRRARDTARPTAVSAVSAVSAVAAAEPRLGLEGSEDLAREVRSVLRRLAGLVGRDMDRALRERVAAELEDLRSECLGESEPQGQLALQEAEALMREENLEEAREVLQRGLRRLERSGQGSRRCFDPRDAAGAARLRSMELLAGVLQRLDEGESAADVWRERVRSNADAEALLEYGACLHRLGHLDEAEAQYGRVPNADARRHFHTAALCWDRGDRERAFEALVRGLQREREVGEQLKALQTHGLARGYWKRYGSVWSLGARRFFEKVYREPAVRFTLRRTSEKGQRPRQLLPARTRDLLLQRCI